MTLCGISIRQKHKTRQLCKLILLMTCQVESLVQCPLNKYFKMPKTFWTNHSTLNPETGWRLKNPNSFEHNFQRETGLNLAVFGIVKKWWRLQTPYCCCFNKKNSFLIESPAYSFTSSVFVLWYKVNFMLISFLFYDDFFFSCMNLNFIFVANIKPCDKFYVFVSSLTFSPNW